MYRIMHLVEDIPVIIADDACIAMEDSRFGYSRGRAKRAPCLYSYICPSVRPSVSNGGSPEVAMTPKLGLLHLSTEKFRHLGNSVTESAWTTTAYSRVINVHEHARHV